MDILRTYFVFALLYLKSCQSLRHRPKVTYDILYSSGVDSYNAGRWYQCYSFLNRALDDYRFYRENVLKCRLKCREEITNNSTKLEFTVGDLTYFEKILRNANCLRTCKREAFGTRPENKIDKSTEEAFTSRKIYHYIQFCAYKLEYMKEAVAAAYTFYMGNKGHDAMLQNLNYYRQLREINTKDFVDLEIRPYQVHYIESVTAYNEQDWPVVASSMETAITEYYKEEDRCRLNCEEGYDHRGVPEYIIALADHFVSVLRCQLDCERRLSLILGDVPDDFVADHFHYLQYAYFKMNNIEKSMEAIGTYLMLNPEDETMKRNKIYFLKEDPENASWFTPRADAKAYIKRRRELSRLLKYVDEIYAKTREADISLQRPPQKDSGDYEKVAASRNNNPGEHHMARYHKLGLTLLAEDKDLKGPRRYLVEGFLKEEQCQEMVNFANVIPEYDGVHMMKLVQAIGEVREDPELEVSLRVILRMSEYARHYTMKYNNLTSLYFKRMTVMCWEPSTDDGSKCLRQEDGTCIDEFEDDDAIDYVGILFLNDRFTDGEFFFANENKTMQVGVLPRCGRLVGFPSSHRHGIKPFATSQHCALTMTFTVDPEEEDVYYEDARITVEQLNAKKRNKNLNNTAIINEMKDQGMSIEMDGDVLGGKERFVADGLLSEDACENLIDLATAGGIEGDGYLGNTSPHTAHEHFSGIDVLTAAEEGSILGDGYEGRKGRVSQISPHTKYEMFGGLTITRAAKLAKSEMVDRRAVELYLESSEKGRLLLEKYFNLTQPLYLDFTHLVCRTAIDGTDAAERTDLSHPIHADNCVLKTDGTCKKEFPAYTQRDYSAILYLNGDFEGGDFFFAHANKTEQAALTPKCGRFVAFNAGSFHGVKAVLKGKRCALALWATLNPDFQELAHSQAWDILDAMLTPLGPPKIHEEL